MALVLAFFCSARLGEGFSEPRLLHSKKIKLRPAPARRLRATTLDFSRCGAIKGFGGSITELGAVVRAWRSRNVNKRSADGNGPLNQQG